MGHELTAEEKHHLITRNLQVVSWEELPCMSLNLPPP